VVSGLFDKDFNSESVISTLQQMASLSIPITKAEVHNRHWVLASQRAIQPIEIATDLWICPAWHRPPTLDSRTISITPGLVFGTGKHPSAVLCLKKLATLDLKNAVWGCGFGILAIVTLVLGAPKALAVDIDNNTLDASHNHAVQNNVRDQLTISRPVEEVPNNFQCQLVVANLLAHTLIKLAKTLDHYLADNGRLLLSGLLEEKAIDVMSAFSSKYSFESVSCDGWAMITAIRK